MKEWQRKLTNSYCRINAKLQSSAHERKHTHAQTYTHKKHIHTPAGNRTQLFQNKKIIGQFRHHIACIPIIAIVSVQYKLLGLMEADDTVYFRHQKAVSSEHLSHNTKM